MALPPAPAGDRRAKLQGAAVIRRSSKSCYRAAASVTEIFPGSDVSDRREVVRWVALHILPHEADVRKWLHRSIAEPADVNDLIQQAYCRLSELDYVGHIRNGRAYFFATVRSILLERIRRERIVQIQAVTDLDALCIVDESPSPETVIGAKLELCHVLKLINSLPAAYRDVLKLRRIEGLSQKETAMRLGVTEKVVENNSTRGLKMLLAALTQARAAGMAVEPIDDDKHLRHARY
ncbi:RNA polymerase subunit sigma-24 [Sphingomonas oleivorans]|uniref:RNA polymerase subunit sigma-24 n=1 Tax=Sphingomonas oleivorans TaxID=1735121 RepID=A0A2T5FZR0_9SPHN|nr:sigma-70 family RNA polymerase sigma factor [Sphingomonas oleivorans]PTQ12196.1 RNA polymerase subunit sigma-24 [Sphingomonas oleivorans]